MGWDLKEENSSSGEEVREWDFHGVEGTVPETGCTRAEQLAAQEGEECRLWVHPSNTTGL